MARKLQLFYAISDIYDPYKNLAAENAMMLQLGADSKILFLYRNRPSVVMGRFQNPWVECHLDVMAKESISLVRRQSGGGCVYHDLGNMNWSFIDSQREIAKSDHVAILSKTLSDFGVETRASDRTDILAISGGQAFKISGSAFKQKRDRNIHHGTALINSDLSLLKNILQVRNPNIQTKATSSNPNPVINLADINPVLNHEKFQDKLLENFENFYETSASPIDLGAIWSVSAVSEYEKQLQDFPWLYGQTPRFTHEIQNEYSQFSFTVYKGIIEAAHIESTAVHPTFCSMLSKLLIGKSYSIQSIQSVVNGYEEDAGELLPFLLAKIAI